MSTPFYLPLLGSLSAFLLTLSLVPTKNVLTKTLEAYQASTPQRREQSTVEKLVLRSFSGKTVGGLSQKLLEAGWYDITPVQIILRVIGGAIAGIVLVLLFSRSVHLEGWLTIFLSITTVVCCAYVPIYLVERAREKRKVEVQRTLPDFLDMVAATVQAGLSVNAALGYAVDAAPGALGSEIREALSEIRLGRSRSEALHAAASRLNQVEFSTTITALTQAERLGANIAKVLTELAEDTRNHRIMMAEEHGAKLPVKMAFPMAFFMLPAIFTVIFGTVIANYLENVRH